MALRAPCVSGTGIWSWAQAGSSAASSQPALKTAGQSPVLKGADTTSINIAHAQLLGEAEHSREWTEQLCQRYFSNLSQGRCILPKNACSPGNWSSVLMCRWWGRPDNLLHRHASGVQSCLSLLLNIISVHLSESTNFSSPQKC